MSDEAMKASLEQALSELESRLATAARAAKTALGELKRAQGGAKLGQIRDLGKSLAEGRDAAGRLQYRYHADWQRVRETRKARRLARLAEALPRIRRSIGQHLGGQEPTRSFTLSAVI